MHENLFFAMSKTIVSNESNGFGGAFVIVPPAEGGEALSTLIVDANLDPAAFWGLLQAKCTLALKEIEDKQRQKNAGFGGRF